VVEAEQPLQDQELVELVVEGQELLMVQVMQLQPIQVVEVVEVNLTLTMVVQVVQAL
jgi:hypothetical protein